MAAQLIVGSNPTITADRGGLTPAFPNGTAGAAASGLGTQNSWGSAIAIQDQLHGMHPRELTFWLLTHLNTDTLTAGAFTVDVSADGINWIDSGVSAVSASTSDSHVVVLKLSVYVTGTLLPARYVRFHVSTAFTDNAGLTTFDCGLVV